MAIHTVIVIDSNLLYNNVAAVLIQFLVYNLLIFQDQVKLYNCTHTAANIIISFALGTSPMVWRKLSLNTKRNSVRVRVSCIYNDKVISRKSKKFQFKAY